MVSPNDTVVTVEACNHRCYTVLQSRRKAVRNKGYRVALLSDVIKQRTQAYMPESMLHNFEFLHWHHKTCALAAKPRSWSIQNLAEAICTFDKILSDSAKVADKIQAAYPQAITLFQSFMIEVYKECEVVEMENIHSSRIKCGGQKGNTRLQDNVDMSNITDSDLDVDNCAYCKHRFIIPIGMDINEITKYNCKVQKVHLEKMKTWNSTPSKKKGTKPRAAKTLSQHLACLCC